MTYHCFTPSSPFADIFAVNQHPGAEQKDDLNNLRTAIDLSQATLVVLDSAGTPLERVWWVLKSEKSG